MEPIDREIMALRTSRKRSKDEDAEVMGIDPSR